MPLESVDPMGLDYLDNLPADPQIIEVVLKILEIRRKALEMLEAKRKLNGWLSDCQIESMDFKSSEVDLTFVSGPIYCFEGLFEAGVNKVIGDVADKVLPIESRNTECPNSNCDICQDWSCKSRDWSVPLLGTRKVGKCKFKLGGSVTLRWLSCTGTCKKRTWGPWGPQMPESPWD